MNKTKVKCPRCHSDQLYKFGLDKQANKKYQCKKCKRQFAPDSVRRPKQSKAKLSAYNHYIAISNDSIHLRNQISQYTYLSFTTTL